MGGEREVGREDSKLWFRKHRMFLPGKLFDQSIPISLRCAVICDLSLRES